MFTDFYTLQSSDKQDDTTHICKIKLNTQHQIFDVHFPASPIVPGACMLQIAKELVNRLINRELCIKSAKNIKFLNIINPTEINELIFTISISDNKKSPDQVNAKITISAGETIFAKFSLLFCIE